MTPTVNDAPVALACVFWCKTTFPSWATAATVSGNSVAITGTFNWAAVRPIEFPSTKFLLPTPMVPATVVQLLLSFAQLYNEWLRHGVDQYGLKRRGIEWFG